MPEAQQRYGLSLAGYQPETLPRLGGPSLRPPRFLLNHRALVWHITGSLRLRLLTVLSFMLLVAEAQLFPPSYSGRVTLSELDRPHYSNVADMDGDGLQDALSVANSINNVGQVVINWNNGGGSFTGGQTVATGGYPWFFTVADVNRDGRLDIVLVETLNIYYSGQAPQFPGNTIWLENVGQRAFTRRSIGQAPDARRAAVFDVDGDHDLDVVTYGSASPTMYWFENSGALPPVWTRRTWPLQALDICPFDVDIDGDLVRTSNSCVAPHSGCHHCEIRFPILVC